MLFSFFHHTVKRTKDEPVLHPVVHVQEAHHNTTEGSEFLDDAIRIEDWPVVYTEESVAPGSPENLL